MPAPITDYPHSDDGWMAYANNSGLNQVPRSVSMNSAGGSLDADYMPYMGHGRPVPSEDLLREHDARAARFMANSGLAAAGVAAAPRIGMLLLRGAKAVARPASAINDGVFNALKVVFPKAAPYLPKLRRISPWAAWAGVAARMADAGTGATETNKDDSSSVKGAKGLARAVIPLAQAGNLGGTAVYSAANAIGDKALSPAIREYASNQVGRDEITGFLDRLRSSDKNAWASLLLSASGASVRNIADKAVGAARSRYGLYDALRKRFPEKLPRIDMEDIEAAYSRGVQGLQATIANSLSKSNNWISRRLGNAINEHPRYFGSLFRRMRSGDYIQPALVKTPFFAGKAALEGVSDAVRRHIKEYAEEHLANLIGSDSDSSGRNENNELKTKEKK